jgi:ClpP class serine protease
MHGDNAPALARLGTGLLALSQPSQGADWLVWANARAEHVLTGDSNEGVLATDALAAYHDDRHRPYEIAGGVAVITVSGLLLKDYRWIGDSWATGYAQIRMQVEIALQDDGVEGIVLLVDSGGGYVDGLFELTAHLRDAREVKPIYAIVDSCACSAAYAIAATANSISASGYSTVGSIGVLMVHWDFSKMLDEWGLKPTILFSGKHKVDGNPFQPLPDIVQERFQSEIAEMRSLFADDVALGRGDRFDADAAMGTEARVYGTPSQITAAQEMGMIDGIMAADDAFSALVTHLTADGGTT